MPFPLIPLPKLLIENEYAENDYLEHHIFMSNRKIATVRGNQEESPTRASNKDMEQVVPAVDTGVVARKLEGVQPSLNTINLQISKKKKVANDSSKQFGIMQLRKSLIKKGCYYRKKKKLRRLGAEKKVGSSGDSGEDPLGEEPFGIKANKNFHVHLAKMY